MLYVALAELAVIVVLLVVVLLVARAAERALLERELRWERERQVLLERIQRPERTPFRQTPDREPREPRDTDLAAAAQVGRVVPGAGPAADAEDG